jgi:hypothetical protein
MVVNHLWCRYHFIMTRRIEKSAMKAAIKKTTFSAALTLLLALSVAVGASLAVVLSNDMAVKMAVSIDVDEKCSSGCDSCPDGADCKIAACSALAFTLCPTFSSVKSPARLALFPFVQYAPRDGPDSIEPYPPKFHNFG